MGDINIKVTAQTEILSQTNIDLPGKAAVQADNQSNTDLIGQKHGAHGKHSATNTQDNEASDQTQAQAQAQAQAQTPPPPQTQATPPSISSNPFMNESVQTLINNLYNAMSLYGYGSTDGANIQNIYYYATALFAKYNEATPSQQEFINSIMNSSMNGNITINFPGAPGSDGSPTSVTFSQSGVSFGQFLVEMMTMMHYYQDLSNGDSTTEASSDTQSYLQSILANLQGQSGNFNGNTPQWFTDMLQGAQNWGSGSGTNLNTWMSDAATALGFGPGSTADPNMQQNMQFMFQQYIAGAVGSFSNDGSGTDWLNDYNHSMIDSIMQNSKNPWEEMVMLMSLLQGIGNNYNNQMTVSGDAMNTLSSASNIVNQMIAIFNNPNPSSTDAQNLAYLTQELQTLSDNNPVLGNLGGSTGLIDNSLQNILQQSVSYTPSGGSQVTTTLGQLFYDAENGTNGTTFGDVSSALQGLFVQPGSGTSTGSTSVPTASSTISNQLGALVQEVGSSSSTFSAQTNQLSQMTQTFLSVFKEIEQDYLQQMQPMIDAQKSAIM